MEVSYSLGGSNDYGEVIATCELYHPSTGNWSITSSMYVAREDHIAITLSDGKILVIGSSGDSDQAKIIEMYDPSTGNWTIVAPMSVGRYSHTATLLLNGKVLVTGGTDGKHPQPHPLAKKHHRCNRYAQNRRKNIVRDTLGNSIL